MASRRRYNAVGIGAKGVAFDRTFNTRSDVTAFLTEYSRTRQHKTSDTDIINVTVSTYGGSGKVVKQEFFKI